MEFAPKPSREIRSHILSRVSAWREMLPADDQQLFGTLGSGMAWHAVDSVAILLRRAVTVLLPEADVGSKPTFGKYVNAVERYGRSHSLACTGQARRLVLPTEVAILNTMSRTRARLAHLEEVEIAGPGDVGYFMAAEMREILDLVETVLALPIFDELVCRENTTGATPPTDDPAVM
jgi:hypothetical protein